MKTIKVNLNNRSYPIIINADDFKQLAQLILKLNLGTDAFIITNSRIAKLYAGKLKKALAGIKIKFFFKTVKDSETSKSIDEYMKTVKAISAMDTGKRIFIIALGGGVIGDLSGFVAATYKRGINYVQVPTTLLAQVDSAIGGKTAVDLATGKNLVGAFYQPRIVYSNISVLKSLPRRQIKSGLAEIIKYGVIVEPRLFNFCDKNYKKILALEERSLSYIISTASKIKAKIVSFDEKETKGMRTILNFGHTIGHALETAVNYKTLNHGEAISIGMVCAAEIAEELGIMEKSHTQNLIKILKKFKLPVSIKNVNIKKVFAAFYHDKKFINGKIRMILPTRIGHVIVSENIQLSIIKKVMEKRLRAK
ncbi:MAG: 3-dehydroquinate synthase [Candidatus Omnitrophota bacterium]